MTAAPVPIRGRTRPHGMAYANWLTLVRRRGLVWTIVAITIGLELVVYTVLAILHAANPEHHGPAGGIDNFAGGAGTLALLGAIAGGLAGATAGAGDLGSGMFRELVITGRSRVSIFFARVPGGLGFLLPFIVLAYLVPAAFGVFATGYLPAPSGRVILATGVWVLAEAAFYFVVALGLASLIGSRTYTIVILLVFRIPVTHIIKGIAFFGAFREIVPLLSFERLAPRSIADKLAEGDQIPMSVAAAVIVLTLWVAVWLAAGAWRTATRDA